MSRPRHVSLTPKRDDPIREWTAKFYRSARWRDTRAAALRREPLCRRCQAIASHVHHIIELIVRPDLATDPLNLECLCPSCHSLHHKAGPR